MISARCIILQHLFCSMLCMSNEGNRDMVTLNNLTSSLLEVPCALKQQFIVCACNAFACLVSPLLYDRLPCLAG
jgi:hypothetical protein